MMLKSKNSDIISVQLKSYKKKILLTSFFRLTFLVFVISLSIPLSSIALTKACAQKDLFCYLISIKTFDSTALAQENHDFLHTINQNKKNKNILLPFWKLWNIDFVRIIIGIGIAILSWFILNSYRKYRKKLQYPQVENVTTKEIIVDNLSQSMDAVDLVIRPSNAQEYSKSNSSLGNNRNAEYSEKREVDKIEYGKTKYLKPENPNYINSSIKNMQSHSQKKSFIEKEIDIIISKFNSRDVDYFKNSRFTPVKLIQKSIENSASSKDEQLLQVEREFDRSKAQYLQFSIEDWHWLIPNISSPYLKLIFRDLRDNQQAFKVDSLSSEEIGLIKPAQLKPNWFRWDIIELGKLHSIQVINLNCAGEDLPKLLINTVIEHQLESSSVGIEHGSKSVDLAIINFLQKNDQSTFMELQLGIPCDEETLRESLETLLFEEFVLINKREDGKLAYKLI